MVLIGENAATLPVGKYTLVGIDVDTTGRRLIDEIVQLAAYTPDKQYAQYIMPYMNLNPAARQRHQVRVITIGFYRLLKCMQTSKVVKSKSEYAALKNFLDWIELVQSSDTGSKGVILIYHEERKFIPYMILEAMRKYDLLARFLETAKSFANSYELAEEKCSSTVNNYSLRNLSKILLNNNCPTNSNVEQNNNEPQQTPEDTKEISSDEQEEQSQQSSSRRRRSRAVSNPNDLLIFEGSASVRSKLAFEVAMNLTKLNAEGGEVERASNTQLDAANLLSALHKYAHPVCVEIEELQTEGKNLERQNSFRPVFLQYFKTTLYHRVKAVKFRIVLAENGHDLNNLKIVWTEKRKEGLAEIIQTISDLKAEEKTELVELFDSFFDPSKTTIKPIVKRSRRRQRRSRNKENNPRDVNKGGAGDRPNGSIEVNSVPDSTTNTPPIKQITEKKIMEKRPKTNIMSNNNAQQAITTSNL